MRVRLWYCVDSKQKTPPGGRVLLRVVVFRMQHAHHESNINPFSDKSKLFVFNVLR
ncbi:hypothetical protein ABIE06_003454 [Pantoea dispersa]